MPDRTYRGNPAPGGSAGNGEGESLSFILPSFPVSFNKLYDIDHLSRSVRLTDQAALWKTRTIPFVKPCRWPQDWLLSLSLIYESPSWLTKKGTPRRIDVQNLEKLVIDTMFAKWGTDDCRLVRIVSEKAYGPREQIRVRRERVRVELGGDCGSQS
jgi:hypothetical protein